ncbi:MAG: hypothetical protein J5804_04065 [Eggerthellaceae bacterium]|nr:hypothetical protein [Eggerthellaceae bacterium]
MQEETQSVKLDCGIAHARLEAWLVDELALSKDDASMWVFENGNASCIVALSHLEDRKLGSFSFERTQVLVDGESAAVAAFMKLFTLRFVSAGG